MFQKVFHRNFPNIHYVTLKNVPTSKVSFVQKLGKLVLGLKNESKEIFTWMQTNDWSLPRQPSKEEF